MDSSAYEERTANAPVRPSFGSSNSTPQPSRSHYYLSRNEILKGVANRFVFSRGYIILYLSAAILSLVTVVLSLTQDCPTSSFYVLETLINGALILEVAVRLLAFGKQFWKSHWNTLDLIVTLFCVTTVVVMFFSGCSAKGEELFDTILLVGRNVLQFGRLASVMRRSGKSIFRRPPDIDLTAARDYSFSLDLDLDDDEAIVNDRRADGGDIEAQRVRQQRASARGARGGEQAPFLLEDDEDDS